MKDRSNLFLIAVALILVVGALMLNNNFNNYYNNPDVTSPYKDWANDKIVESIQIYDAQGNACQVSDFFGQPLVLYYWGLWQEGSQESLDSFLQASQTYQDKAEFLLVVRPESLEDDLSESIAYLEGKELPTVCYDRDHQTIHRLELPLHPLTFFVNTQGECNLFGQGPLTAEDFATGMEDIRL